MPTITLCFRIHIPYRLSRYTDGHGGVIPVYFDAAANKAMVDILADECYLPANAIISNLIRKGNFKIAFSISGTTLELFQTFRPDVIESLQSLVQTGAVEILSETYYNSLSWLYSKKDFRLQVEKHASIIRELFGITPAVFRNTEFVYNNELAAFIAAMGYKGIVCEGLDRLLKGSSLNQVYHPPGTDNIGLLLRNRSLSDDIAFRFGQEQWSEYPLTADKYAQWVHAHTDACNISLFMDYETFGTHKKKSSGIFDFLGNLPSALLSDKKWSFVTPSEALEHCDPKAVYDVAETISWNDDKAASCVCCENTMQNNMLKKIYSLEYKVNSNGNEMEQNWWRQLQSADHFYYMSETDRFPGDIYGQQNPFESPEDAYKNYRNIITDFEIKLIHKGLSVFREQQQYTINTSLY